MNIHYAIYSIYKDSEEQQMNKPLHKSVGLTHHIIRIGALVSTVTT